MKKRSQPQIKTIWGLAAQLDLDKDSLYSVIQRVTGKDSMRACTGTELNRVVMALGKYKDNQKVAGMASKEQLWKIRQLETALGWQDNPSRLKGFVKKFYHTERLEWLKSWQAHKLIESLKKMLEKQSEVHHG